MLTADSWLEQYYGTEFFSGNFSHLKSLISRLDLRNPPGTIVTIGGTNGKGQTCRVLSRLLMENHKTTALWTSPHLSTVCERFQLNGNNISSEKLLSLFIELQEALTGYSIKVSYFEFLFLAFLKMVKSENLDVIILEVGLGGRLDAVNTMDANIFGLTSISRDHQELLGSRLSSILYEKLGILRDNQIFYSALELDYLRRLTADYLKNFRAEWIDLFCAGELNRCDSFDIRNSVLAHSIASQILATNLEFSTSDYSKRSSLELRGVLYDLFPTHNIDGMRKLVQFLNDRHNKVYDLVLVSFSKRPLRDLETMMKTLLLKFDRSQILLTTFNHMKGIGGDELEKIAGKYKVNVTTQKMLLHKLQDTPVKNILVTGSNYFLGDFLSRASSR